MREEEKGYERRRRKSWNNRFRLIIRSVIRRMRRIRKSWNKTRFFSMTISTPISTPISTFTTLTTLLIFTINLNLTLFEPHQTPPFHSPRNPHSPLSSPHTLSPHSIPLVTSRHL